jgi:hypothetical protein
VVARHFNGPPGESVVKLHMPLVDNTCDAGGWRSRPYILRGDACLLRKHASVCKKCCVMTGVQQWHWWLQNSYPFTRVMPR